MIANELERIAHQLIDGYFGRRAEKLDSISLEELLANANPHLLCLHGVARADKFLESLLQERIRPFEEATFSELLARLRTEGAVDSDLTLIRLLRDCSGVQRTVYDKALARVLNRLCLSFLNGFSLADGSIDWKKLVRFAPHAGEQEKGEVPNGVRGG